jgi:hypothetical protein
MNTKILMLLALIPIGIGVGMFIATVTPAQTVGIHTTVSAVKTANVPVSQSDGIGTVVTVQVKRAGSNVWTTV